MIVALTGKIGSGKSTAAQSFLNIGYKKLSFADVMKRTCADVFPWVPYNAWWNPILKETPFADMWIEGLIDHGAMTHRPVVLNRYVIERFNKVFNLDCSKVCDQKGYVMRKFESPRECLQFVGTEVLRATDPDCHIKATMAAVIASGVDVNWVCDDCRFDNEAQAIKDMGGIVVELLRPYNSIGIIGHESEKGISSSLIDYRLENTWLRSEDVIEMAAAEILGIWMARTKVKDQYLKDNDGA